jgi:hypothetical protein
MWAHEGPLFLENPKKKWAHEGSQRNPRICSSGICETDIYREIKEDSKASKFQG